MSILKRAVNILRFGSVVLTSAVIGLLGVTVARESSSQTIVDVAVQGDRVTIRANGALLDDVLSALERVTGVRVEGKRGTSERVRIGLGPVPIQQAWMLLLDRSRYDYAIVSSPDEPNRVERVLLRARVGSDTGETLSIKQAVTGRAEFDERSTATKRVSNLQYEADRQRRDFERAFGACTTQGCDAS